MYQWRQALIDLSTAEYSDNSLLWTAIVSRYRSSIFSSGLARFCLRSAGQGQQNLAFCARDATARQFSTVGRVVPTTSSDHDSYLSSGSRAYDTICYHHRIDFSDRRSCADVVLCGARELDVHRRTSIPKQKGHHRYYLDGVLSRAFNA